MNQGLRLIGAVAISFSLAMASTAFADTYECKTLNDCIATRDRTEKRLATLLHDLKRELNHARQDLTYQEAVALCASQPGKHLATIRELVLYGMGYGADAIRFSLEGLSDAEADGWRPVYRFNGNQAEVEFYYNEVDFDFSKVGIMGFEYWSQSKAPNGKDPDGVPYATAYSFRSDTGAVGTLPIDPDRREHTSVRLAAACIGDY